MKLSNGNNITFYHFSRYWIKYGLFLFNASLSKIKNEKNVKDLSKGDSFDNANVKIQMSIVKNDILEENLLYPKLNLIDIENSVTCNYISTLGEARKLFVFSQNWLKKSKEFYTLDSHPFDFVNTILDLSELYRYVAFYENDLECQYNVQKRRVDVLETLSAILKGKKH